MFKIPVVLDVAALDEAGLMSSTPVTLHISGVSLRTALELMLHELELTYVVSHEVLLITTPEGAETELNVRIYPVADLVPTGDYDSLIEVVTSTVALDAWNAVGGAGVIEPFVPLKVLVIAQEYRTHEEIDNLFVALRRAKSQAADQDKGVAPKQYAGKLQLQVYRVMGKPEQVRELANTIRALVLQASWGNGADAATIQVFGDRLLIRQTRVGHRMVQELIDELGLSSGMSSMGMGGMF